MRVVIAPDKFKGSLQAEEVCAAVAAGIRSVTPDVDIVHVPMADGGEGTLDAAVASGFARHTATVSGPLGAQVGADFGVRGTEAVVEMATASGLALVSRPERDALAASSYGTGECIRAALDLGVTRITLAIGGSASTDGGAGLLEALGARLLDADGAALGRGGGPLTELETFDLSGLDPRLARTEFVLASDVEHALLGPEGAAAVFGPQKGASPAQVATLERGLARLSEVLDRALAGAGAVAAEPGSGAAGGVGYAAIAVLGAERRPGVEVVAGLTGLADKLAGADLVITGEGSFDEQSLGGKTPWGVARAAVSAGCDEIIAVCGRSTLAPEQWRAAGFTACCTVAERAASTDESIRDAARYLTQIGSDLAARLLRTSPTESSRNTARPTMESM
ncbi:glycerate kinase [Leucobacter albus]|uniref:Glycerate kinase n=1 Tax=Leucobacter albus TaxID=272210 RepID=A0ABW3TRL3_9MICO